MRLLYFALSLAVLVLDRWTKAVVSERLSLGESVPVIRNFLHLTHTQNPGIAFSLFDHGSSRTQNAVLIGLSLIAIAVVAVLAWRTPRQKIGTQISFALILGGAGGNLWDRVAQGKVTDFIDVFVRDHHWPIFNIADSALSLGMIGLAIAMLFFDDPEMTAT